MAELLMLAWQCGVAVDASLMAAVVEHESQGNPYAIGVNGGAELERQPRDRPEAIATAEWLSAHGYSFDAGLGQINSANLEWLGLGIPELFDPCANVRAAARVLSDCHERAGALFSEGDEAWRAALSCYNTGSFTRGVTNGYVDSVLGKAGASAAGGRGPARPVPLKARRAGAGSLRASSAVRRRTAQLRSTTGGDGVPDAFATGEEDAFRVLGTKGP